jgi:hypothetical protein
VVLAPVAGVQVGGGVFDPTGSDGTIQFADDGDKTNSSPGRARSKPLKPLCRESRIASAEPVVTPCALFSHRGRAAGAASARLSLRPLLTRDEPIDENLGRSAPREREVVCDGPNAQTFRRHHPRMRVIQYSRDVRRRTRGRGVLDTPCAGYDGSAGANAVQVVFQAHIRQSRGFTTASTQPPELASFFPIIPHRGKQIQSR